jgi:hypothetical protein
MLYETKPEWYKSSYIQGQGTKFSNGQGRNQDPKGHSLSPMERKVLTMLKNNMTPHGYYPYCHNLIAKEIGCTELTVMRSIRQLNFLGYIEIIYKDEYESGGVLRVL